MSLYFRALPWVIPQLLCSARSGTEVAIVSPWVADVVLESPALVHVGAEPKLSNLFQWLSKLDIRIILVVRERDYRLERVFRNLQQKTRDQIKVVQVDYIHTKAVVTEHLALTTSANLLDTSLYRNRETVNLAKHSHGSARRWLTFEQDLTI